MLASLLRGGRRDVGGGGSGSRDVESNMLATAMAMQWVNEQSSVLRNARTSY